jgi:hypothetical protein
MPSALAHSYTARPVMLDQLYRAAIDLHVEGLPVDPSVNRRDP